MSKRIPTMTVNSYSSLPWQSQLQIQWVTHYVTSHLMCNLLSAATEYVKYVKIISVTNNTMVRWDLIPYYAPCRGLKIIMLFLDFWHSFLDANRSGPFFTLSTSITPSRIFISYCVLYKLRGMAAWDVLNTEGLCNIASHRLCGVLVVCCRRLLWICLKWNLGCETRANCDELWKNLMRLSDQKIKWNSI